jgi:hypothetical protein
VDIATDMGEPMDQSTWQEVAILGEGAGGAGVTEHGAHHREVSGGAATAVRALALRASKKSGKQERERQPQLVAAPPHLHTELVSCESCEEASSSCLYPISLSTAARPLQPRKVERHLRQPASHSSHRQVGLSDH